jgi:hypothetical protein
MKKYLLILLLAAAATSCKKESSTPTVTGSITYTNITKVYAGSNMSVRIYFTVANSARYKSIEVAPYNMAYTMPAVIKDGSQFVQDNMIGTIGGGSYRYYFITTDINGVRAISEPFIITL